MSSIVNSKKPLSENTIFKSGKFYSVYTKDDHKINGRLVSIDSEKLVLLENEKATHNIQKSDIVKVKKFSTFKSILLPTSIVGIAAGTFIIVFKGDEGMHQ